MILRYLTLVALSLATMGALAQPARGESTAAVVVTPNTGEALAAPLYERAGSRLRATSYEIRTDVESLDAAAASLENCSDPSACLPDAARGLVDIVVLVGAQGNAEQTIVTLWLFDGEVGQRLRVDRRFCQACDPKKLDGAVDFLIDQALEAVGARSTGDTLISVETDPPGCTVALDNKVVGLSGRTYTVGAGQIAVRIEKTGYEPQNRTLEIEPGETRQLTVVLTQIAQAPGKNWLLIGGLGGGGAAALALGITWIAIDGDRIEDGKRLRQRRESLVPGVVATGVGAALITTAAILWWRQPESGPALTVAPIDGGLGVRVGGSF